MIYLLSDKFFRKHAEKIFKLAGGFIVDANNYSVTGIGVGKSKKLAIAQKYNYSHTVGGLCPDNRLYGYLKKLKDGGVVDTRKLADEKNILLHEKSFIAGVNSVGKAFTARGINNPLNIYVVFPTPVYKGMRGDLEKRFLKLFGEPPQRIIYTEEDLKADFGILQRKASPDTLRYVDKRTKRNEDKYDLRYDDKYADEDE